ncbi:D-alanyl-D-alanine carboxypeptidase [Polaribacter sp. Hel1_85]|nr:D-alanyl-D-alanine carboxypeptidase [Polaribacter sp. Hel1_85]
MEKWHWSYIPLAKKYLEYYNSNFSYENITGFKGSELAGELNIIKDFVNGISNSVDDMR